jgi:hypothetical protein
MTPSAETLLLPTLLAFYAKDCLLLLDADEGVLERRGAGRWRVGLGSRHYTLLGRQPCLLLPLAPHRPAYRMRWAMTGEADAAPAWPADAPRALLGLRPWPVAIALALFGGVPLALLGHQPLWALLGSVALVYALIVGALLHAGRHREALGLSRRSWAALGGELLLCPPYAVNLVRRLSLHASPAADLLATARARLDAPELAELQRQCAERIELELQVEGEGTPRSVALAGARRALIRGAEDPP